MPLNLAKIQTYSKTTSHNVQLLNQYNQYGSSIQVVAIIVMPVILLITKARMEAFLFIAIKYKTCSCNLRFGNKNIFNLKK